MIKITGKMISLVFWILGSIAMMSQRILWNPEIFQYKSKFANDEYYHFADVSPEKSMLVIASNFVFWIGLISFLVALVMIIRDIYNSNYIKVVQSTKHIKNQKKKILDDQIERLNRNIANAGDGDHETLDFSIKKKNALLLNYNNIINDDLDRGNYTNLLN